MPFMQEGIEPKNPLDLGIPGGPEAGRRRLRGRRQGSQHRHDRLGRHAAEQGRRLGRRRDAASHGEGHRQADRRLRPHELPDDAGGGRSADAGGLPVPAGTGADHARAQRALVPRAAHRQAAGRAAPCPAERSFAGDARRHAQEIRHRAAAKPRGRDRRRSRRRRRGDRISGRAEDPLGRHPAQDRGRRRRARSAQPRRRAQGRRRRSTASARAAYPNASIDGFLVQEMVSGVEAIVGAAHRPALRAACCWSAPAASWSSSPRMPRCACCRSRRPTWRR